LYRLRIFSSVRLPVPVIVVGNITVGGTGKTPLVIWLADFLRSRGCVRASCCVATAAAAVDWPLTVTPDHDPDVVGDEAVMLARQSRCPVARTRTAYAGAASDTRAPLRRDRE